MQITVKLFSGQDLSFVVNHTPFVIGRSPKCEVVVPHDGVSRHHCQFEVEEGEVWVTDLGSTNGVMIDGARIEPNKRIKWMTYLTLSFGPVQSVHVSFEETRSGMKSKTAQPMTVTAQNLTKTQSYKGPEQVNSQGMNLELEQKSQRRPTVKKPLASSRDDNEKKKKLLIGAILLLLAVGLAFYFTIGQSGPENVEVLEPIE